MQHSLKRFMLVCLMLAMSLTGLVMVAVNAQDDAFSAGLASGSEILAAEGRVSRSGDKQRPGAPRPKRP